MSIKENIIKAKENIPENVTLIAVSKTKPIEYIKEAYEAEIRDFGENKVQELVEKYDYFGKDVRWHLIGHLQRNKVKYIVGKVHLIHSVDSVRLLNEIEKRFGEKNITANILVQINIGKEESKTGIYEEDLEEFLKGCENCNSVKVKGLMAIIPKGNEESCRHYFKKMKKIWDSLNEKQYKNINMEYLSMGMSGDYKIAIEEGSNMVRIGQGIFGARNYNK
ncbi:YggS family pyridoxal phosphate-dependent enzyme [Clostridium acetireducens]|uniref:YggS family pyridoxal phosphate-dependent enzyme n=1 Tax=Clostridium acetireducens TaxID=76489 RepID=UPI000871FC35|nr:YggS family pyridoxal phosphate-dependent enzyme [Clostridium acetireducens]